MAQAAGRADQAEYDQVRRGDCLRRPFRRYMLDNTNSPIPVIVQGLGPMGKEILKAAHADPDFNVVGVVDIDASLAGTKLGDHGLEPGNIVISSSFKASMTADVVLHATGSHLESVAPQIEDALAMGFNVVSTCEELSFPFVRHPALSDAINRSALERELVVVGTGVNPGFMMDRLPLAMASISHSINSIHVKRVQNPRSRRRPFQDKVGMGLSEQEFKNLAANGNFGHVGLEESARLVAVGLNWIFDDWYHELEPVVDKTHSTVNGLIEILEAKTSDGHLLSLHFEAHSDVTESYDSIKINGRPPVDLFINGGIAGDDATAASVLQAAKVITSSRKGLISVLDLPLRHFDNVSHP